jgi:SseB protein C-terminal domain
MAVHGLHFVGEQSGAPEQELKDVLCSYFCTIRTVQRAYLARVSYDNDLSVNVALCICSSRGDHERIVGDIGKHFAELFGAHEHLDIIFVNPEQEKQLASICSPFFC